MLPQLLLYFEDHKLDFLSTNRLLAEQPGSHVELSRPRKSRALRRQLDVVPYPIQGLPVRNVDLPSVRVGTTRCALPGNGVLAGAETRSLPEGVPVRRGGHRIPAPGGAGEAQRLAGRRPQSRPAGHPPGPRLPARRGPSSPPGGCGTQRGRQRRRLAPGGSLPVDELTTPRRLSRTSGPEALCLCKR